MPCTWVWLKTTLQRALVRLNDGAKKNANSDRVVLDRKQRLWDISLSSKTDEQAFAMSQTADEVHTETGTFAPRCEGEAKN